MRAWLISLLTSPSRLTPLSNLGTNTDPGRARGASSVPDGKRSPAWRAGRGRENYAKGEDDKASSCGGNGCWMRVVRAGQAYRGRLIISFAFA